jgi:tRNA 2-selenouridine synthase
LSKTEFISVEGLLERMGRGEANIVDVRAPVEFLAGSIPGSINLPILNDDERARVGTVYKNQGSDQAVALGHELVAGALKESRIGAWSEAVRARPESTFITCFRGGMRSKLAQAWTAENGFPVPRLEGGYKKMRARLMEEIERFSAARELLVLTGKTGAGKTKVLVELKRPKLDLEALAHHRGSAFGGHRDPQPAQIDFENRLALDMFRLPPERQVVIEDESRLIGSVVLPEKLFLKMRSAPVAILDEPLEVRIENTLQEYVVAHENEGNLFPSLRESLFRIQRKLGGVRYQEVAHDLRHAQMVFRETRDHAPSRVWIEKLLVWYYDPLYENSFARRKPTEFVRGDRKKMLEILA